MIFLTFLPFYFFIESTNGEKNLKGISVIYRMRRQILLKLCFWLWIIIFVFMTWSSFCKYFVTFFIHIRIVLFFISCQIVCKWKTPAFLWVAWLQHFAMFCLLVQMNLWIFVLFFILNTKMAFSWHRGSLV